jgi:hypothetical protein
MDYLNAFLAGLSALNLAGGFVAGAYFGPKVREWFAAGLKVVSRWV